MKDYAFKAKVVVILNVVKRSYYPLKPQDIYEIRRIVNNRILKELQTSGMPTIQVREVIWEVLKEDVEK
ncbi:hypothetical protein DRO53_04010 [Candidatus Bathyarchaeota archaeon]|nr:MAG: hypothetical protein DRO53_04010 [Candidatus Bathyarchaeota archaeon]